MARGDTPVTRYTQTPDGVHIAYHVVSEGTTRDLVFMPEWGLPLEGRWQEPTTAGPLRRLASFSRLISFDKRGIGCSDPVPMRQLTAVEEWMDDLRIVMDTVGSRQATLFATNDSGPPAMLFAATYPDRVRGLVLFNSMVRWLASDDYPWAMPPSALAKLLEGIEDDWVTGNTRYRTDPTMAANDRLRQWNAAGRRLQASPGMARAMFEAWVGMDARAILPLIQCPTLVLQRADAYVVRAGQGRYLAEHIPGARYIELPGPDTLWWAGDADRIVDEVETFVTGARVIHDSDRSLATVLFTDIVGSTEQAAAMGDRRWRSLLEGHDRVAREIVEQHRGRLVKSTGDGLLATFDGPGRAIRCALMLTDALRPLAIQIRAGLHTGEIETVDHDVAGIAVHTAQRVCALATAGEVLVSRTVTDLVAGSGIGFDERGEHELKGVPGAWKLFAVQA